MALNWKLDLSLDLCAEEALSAWFCPEAEMERLYCWVDALRVYFMLEKAAATTTGRGPARARKNGWASHEERPRNGLFST